MKYLAKFLSLCMVFYLGLAITTVACADNLLTNPNFDDGLNDWYDLYGWPSWLSIEIYHSPPYAAAKTIETVEDEDYWSQIYQEVDYSAGQDFYATMWAKTEIFPAAEAKAGLIIHFLDINGVIIPTPPEEIWQDEIGGQTDWRLLYVSGITPEGTVKIRLSGYVWAKQDDPYAQGGNAYYDDAVLSTEYIAAPVQRRLINPGFENALNDWYDLYGWPSWLSTDIKHSGNYAAAKTIEDVTSRAYWSQIYQELDIPSAAPGRAFNARLWVKTDISPDSSAKAGILIQFFNAEGMAIGPRPHSEIQGQTDWRRLVVSGVVPQGAVKAKFSGYIWAARGDLEALGGIAYYDDAAIARVNPFDIEAISIEP